VVTRARVDNLELAYRELPPGTRHTFSLDELSIHELGEHQPLSLRATGLFEGKPFVLEGTSDTIAELVESSEPSKVQLTLSSAESRLRAQGTIVDPVAGRGLDLHIETNIPQISELIEIFWDEIPVLGTLEGSLDVRGDYSAPILENIDLHLQRDEEVDLIVRGSVSDVLTGADLDLQLEGESSNPEVLSWLLFRKHDRMQMVQISGRLQSDRGRLSLNDLNASAVTADGLELRLDGNIIVHPADRRLTPDDAGLTVAFDSPTMAAANLIGLGDVPELGPVSGNLRLALGRDALGIYEADIDIGSRENSLIKVKGDFGHVRLADASDLSGLRLETDIQTAELARLGKQLDYALPALGPARLRGTLLSRGTELVQTVIKATGMLGTQLDDPSRFRAAMDVDIQATELARLGEQFDVTLPELGQSRISGRLESNPSGWLFRDARMVIGKAEDPIIRANGNVTSHKQEGSNINVTLDVAVADMIKAYTDQSPGDLGRLEGDAVISNQDGRWGIERFKLASTRTKLYQLNLKGKYDDLVHHDGASINSKLVVENMPMLGEALDLDLSGFGPYRMQGLMSIDKRRLRFDGKATLGNTMSMTNIRGHLREGKPVLSGSIDVPVLHLADFGMGSSATADSGVPAGDPFASPHVFSRKPLNIGFLNAVDLDLALSIDEVESGELAIDSVRGKLMLRNGHLSVTPLSLVFEGGNADIILDIRTTTMPEYRLSVSADDVMLGPLMAQFQGHIPIRGYSNINLDLQAQGRSPHEMASNLSGGVSLGLENARIPKHYVNLLSVDVFGWVISKSGAGQQHMNLNCLVMTFVVDDGMVKSEAIIADGPRLTLGGEINMDLGAETLDIIVIPKQKKRFFSSISPVTVKGPMKDPKIEAIPVKAALKEIGSMALLPGVAIPAFAVGKLWSFLDGGDKPGEGCANIEELREAAKQENTKDKGHIPILDWFRE
jgi:hypothetical protein